MILPRPIPFAEGDVITEPGLYAIPEDLYHADVMCPTPSLSSTVARLIVNSSPLHAWHAHPRLNPAREEKEAKTLDMGKTVHALLLGEGRDIEILDFKDFRTNAAKEARDMAREQGRVPMLREAYEKAERLVSTIHGQVAKYGELAELFDPGTLYETSAVWQEGDLWCRAMLDMVRVFPDFIAIVDVKSTDKTAAPLTIGKQIFNMGYDVQFAFYRRGLRRVLEREFGAGIPPIRCFLLSQERAGPGALSIVEPDEETLVLADKKAVAGMSMWAQCLQDDAWPSYPPFIQRVTLPPWMETQWSERELNDDALAIKGWKYAMPAPGSRADLDDGGNEQDGESEGDPYDVLNAG